MLGTDAGAGDSVGPDGRILRREKSEIRIYGLARVTGW